MRRRRPRVATVLSNDVHIFEMAVPCEVFGIDRSELASPWYEHRLCAVEPGPVRIADADLVVEPRFGLSTLRWADTIVIPAWADAEHPPEAVLDALRAAHRRGARVMSVCTGAFVLAAAGLLDGRRATTHWMHADRLAEMFPDVKVDARVLYVDEGDVLTSAGTAAGIDLCLHVVRLDYGAEVANAVARRMVVPPHRDGGQAQYVDHPVEPANGEEPLTATIEWMLERVAEPLTVEDAARRAAMSPRTFARRFRDVTGTTPHQWRLSQRVLLAQRLLETTDDDVELIADRAGFGSSANLRTHFQRFASTSPQAYRRTFRGAGAGAGVDQVSSRP